MADDTIPPMPDWVPHLWTRGQTYGELLGAIDLLEPHEARALWLFLRDHEEACRPILPPTSDRPQ
jgi:hypothetical protein